jgi:7-keto-8-aminopelargonate synthetase-like enzyme
MVDEAHALGCVGETGGGSFEEFGIDPTDVDIWMGTLSKTLASTGGYIAGSNDVIDLTRNYADGFVYSVAMPPALAASALCALEILHLEPARVARLQENSRHFRAFAESLGLDTGNSAGYGIVPIMVGDSAVATKLSQMLFERRINVAPVTFPGVPMHGARLRFFISSSHTTEHLEQALVAVREELDKLEKSGFIEAIAAATARLAAPSSRA